MKNKRRIKFVSQLNEMDCGRACLKMISLFYGIDKSEQIDKFLEISDHGSSLFDMSFTAEKIGFLSKAVSLTIDELSKIDSPAILHWDSNHYVVIFKIDKNYALIGNPASKILKLSLKELTDHWYTASLSGYALLLLPSGNFFESCEEQKKTYVIQNVFRYIAKFKSLFFQLFCGFLLGSIIQLLLPFLMQNVIDKGILLNNISFIKIVLIAQITLTIGRVAVEFLRSWILMHISIRINIFILTDFFVKIFSLPIRYFETRTKGDFLQRLDDQKRIESFLTNQTINILFAFFNLIIYSGVIIYYNSKIFFLFIGFSVAHTFWIFVFLPSRKKLDNMRFSIGSQIQTNTIQLIDGIKDIKMFNVERKKRWAWEDLRAELFKFNIKSLELTQWQNGGATIINESKNIFITFFCAKLVIDGEITLGMLLSIQYIIGQLNNPIQQFTGFLQSYQDAKLSVERLNEMYGIKDEVDLKTNYVSVPKEFNSIKYNNISLNIGGRSILRSLNFVIERGKMTAIVGESGSGKTSILKLLIGNINPTEGNIVIGDIILEKININDWRNQFSTMLQDSYLFAGTLIDNICLSENLPDYSRFNNVIKIAKIYEMIQTLPGKEEFEVAENGINFSQGQRQRILIARALYKDCDIIILDEATNALDSNTESDILLGLSEELKNKTIIVVAHRLNTIKNADNIIVLQDGQIINQGKHEYLMEACNTYSEFVKNQTGYDGA
ncbi:MULTISPECIES: peptidase domain-containing ABC transporter [unclassified Sphingobacterium]|uniref:peptidase domain-containing ABC transporter n=1 Tax=unclassified Sphingobacterium TaxID=2609468 RepID=UPI0025925F01|nr:MULTISPECIES: peptidase domain-containing ABC transporter [unclassified Sphingobacterium]